MNEREIDPNQTSTFKARLPGGTLLQFTAKRMAEVISIIMACVVGALCFVGVHLIKAIDANTAAIQAGTAETRVRLERMEASNRHLACLQLNRDARDTYEADRRCRISAGVQQP